MISAYFWNGETQELREVTGADLRQAVTWTGGELWVDFEAPSEEEFGLLSSVFNFHPLALEDCQVETPIPKVEAYDDFLFIIMHGAALPTDSEPYLTKELDVFLRPGLLVTHHVKALRSTEATRESVRRSAATVMGKGCDGLLYSILDGLVSHYFPILDELEQATGELEEHAVAQPGAGMLEALQDRRRDVLHLKRILGPQREVITRLSRGEFKYVRAENLFYLRDIADELTRINEQLDLLRELVAGARDSYLGTLSQRTNDIMKVLTIIATVTLPLALLSGIWGMNTWVPGQGGPTAFWTVILVMVVAAGGMLWWLIRKGWW